MQRTRPGACSPMGPPRAGGTRFIGVYLARELVKQGHEVCARVAKPSVAPASDTLLWPDAVLRAPNR